MRGTSPIRNFNFDDEPIHRFCCDFDKLKIELGFNSYYKDSIYIEKPCLLIIEKWKSAKSKICTESRFYDFPEKLGIFWMLLYVEQVESIVKFIVDTIDGRLLDVHIDNPIIKIIEL